MSPLYSIPERIMDQISEFLQPYKDIIGKVAGIVTFGHMLSGTAVLYGVYKKKSSNGTPLSPFLGGIIMCVYLIIYFLFTNLLCIFMQSRF